MDYNNAPYMCVGDMQPTSCWESQLWAAAHKGASVTLEAIVLYYFPSNSLKVDNPWKYVN